MAAARWKRRIANAYRDARSATAGKSERDSQPKGGWETLRKWIAGWLAARCIAWLGVSIGVRNASIDNCIEVNALLEVVMSE
jgi:hypothetical protein